MCSNVKIEITGLKGEVFGEHKHEDGSFTIELEQERFEPFKLKIVTPRGTEEYEVIPGWFINKPKKELLIQGLFFLTYTIHFLSKKSIKSTIDIIDEVE